MCSKAISKTEPITTETRYSGQRDIQKAINLKFRHDDIMHNGLTNGKAHEYSDKQTSMDMDTIVSFVLQSGQVPECGAISVLSHANCILG